MSDLFDRQREVQQTTGQLVKASAAIQISQRVPAVGRKIWNVLLQHAYPDLPEDEGHITNAPTLQKRIGQPSSRNRTYLEERLYELVDTTVEWNILGKDNREWGAASLLADAKMKDGKVYYSFGLQLRQKLHNPSVFASFQLSLQNRFTNKYALPLYELFIDYSFDGGWCQLPQMKITQLRNLLGVAEDTYQKWYVLRRDVLDTAIHDIEKHTDLSIDYEALAAEDGRAYTDIKLQALRKERVPTSVEEVEGYLRGLNSSKRQELIQEGAETLDPFNRDRWNDQGKQARGAWSLIKDHILKKIHQ
jgi:hypothetical protein